MGRGLQPRLGAFTLAFCLAFLPPYAVAWNIPGHMLSGSIAYQILRAESPATIAKVRAIVEKHPWIDGRWKARLEEIPPGQRDEILFMLASHWADDIRSGPDRAQHRPTWHYINFPFKPDGQPANVQSKRPQAVNILTALVENERIVKTDTNPARRAIALTWLFHLVGDVHQPLHSAQLFTTEYPNGDRGGNLICVRSTSAGKPIALHSLWDGLITSSRDYGQIKNTATALRNREGFTRNQLQELDSAGFEAWAKESFEIATTIAYRHGEPPGTPKGSAKDCRDVADAKTLPDGYARTVGHIADRRIMLAGYRLADLLKRL